MTEKKPQKEKRKKDPYLDRRYGEDRREAYDIDYFAKGGIERRKAKEQRKPEERRKGCVKVSKWSSVCAESDFQKNRRLMTSDRRLINHKEFTWHSG